VKIDALMRDGLGEEPAEAAAAQASGYDGLHAFELQHDPFLLVARAVDGAPGLEYGTSIAVAFARSPMTVAYSAWDLQALTGGRFYPGLGSQVKAHIERRFSMPWSHPAARMREYVLALRAIWASWQDGTTLDFDGEFYRHTLMTPMFSPGPLESGAPRVLLAAAYSGRSSPSARHGRDGQPRRGATHYDHRLPAGCGCCGPPASWARHRCPPVRPRPPAARCARVDELVARSGSLERRAR